MWPLKIQVFEALSPKVMVFGYNTFREMIKVKLSEVRGWPLICKTGVFIRRGRGPRRRARRTQQEGGHLQAPKRGVTC